MQRCGPSKSFINIHYFRCLICKLSIFQRLELLQFFFFLLEGLKVLDTSYLWDTQSESIQTRSPRANLCGAVASTELTMPYCYKWGLHHSAEGFYFIILMIIFIFFHKKLICKQAGTDAVIQAQLKIYLHNIHDLRYYFKYEGIPKSMWKMELKDKVGDVC